MENAVSHWCKKRSGQYDYVQICYKQYIFRRRNYPLPRIDKQLYKQHALYLLHTNVSQSPHIVHTQQSIISDTDANGIDSLTQQLIKLM